MRPLSHSSISMYTECPKKWHFKYIEKVPEKPRHFFSFGKTIHSVLEFFYDVKTLPPPDLKQLLKFYRDNWLAEGYQSEAQEEQYRAQGATIVQDYYRKHIDGFRIPYFTEYRFNIEVDGVKVIGFVDRIDKSDDGRLMIVDYKTSKRPITKPKVREDQQLTMYQMACEELLGMKVEGLTWYHLLSQTPIVSPPHGRELVDTLREKIVLTAEKIKAEEYDPKPDERRCDWCDFKRLCPAWEHLYKTYAPPEKAAAPKVARDDEKLAKLVDRYGKMMEELKERKGKAEELKKSIVASLGEKGYVRAFGDHFSATVHREEHWDFHDKKKVLDAVMRAGYWDRIIAPSAPAVQKLMRDPNLPLDLRDRLQKLGTKVEHATLRTKKTDEEDQ